MRICEHQDDSGVCEYVKRMAFKMGMNLDKKVYCPIKPSGLYLHKVGDFYMLRSEKCPVFKPARGLEDKLEFKNFKSRVFYAGNVKLYDGEFEEDD